MLSCFASLYFGLVPFPEVFFFFYTNSKQIAFSARHILSQAFSLVLHQTVAAGRSSREGLKRTHLMRKSCMPVGRTLSGVQSRLQSVPGCAASVAIFVHEVAAVAVSATTLETQLIRRSEAAGSGR